MNLNNLLLSSTSNAVTAKIANLENKIQTLIATSKNDDVPEAGEESTLNCSEKRIQELEKTSILLSKCFAFVEDGVGKCDIVTKQGVSIFERLSSVIVKTKAKMEKNEEHMRVLLGQKASSDRIIAEKEKELHKKIESVARKFANLNQSCAEKCVSLRCEFSNMLKIKQHKISDLNSEYEKLALKSKACEDEFNVLSHQNSECEEAIKNRENDVQKLSHKLASLEKEYERCLLERDTLNAELAALHEKNQNYDELLLQESESIKIVEKEIEEMREKVDALSVKCFKEMQRREELIANLNVVRDEALLFVKTENENFAKQEADAKLALEESHKLLKQTELENDVEKLEAYLEWNSIDNEEIDRELRSIEEQLKQCEKEEAELKLQEKEQENMVAQKALARKNEKKENNKEIRKLKKQVAEQKKYLSELAKKKEKKHIEYNQVLDRLNAEQIEFENLKQDFFTFTGRPWQPTNTGVPNEPVGAIQEDGLLVFQKTPEDCEINICTPKAPRKRRHKSSGKEDTSHDFHSSSNSTKCDFPNVHGESQRNLEKQRREMNYPLVTVPFVAYPNENSVPKEEASPLHFAKARENVKRDPVDVDNLNFNESRESSFITIDASAIEDRFQPDLFLDADPTIATRDLTASVSVSNGNLANVSIQANYGARINRAPNPDESSTTIVCDSASEWDAFD